MERDIYGNAVVPPEWTGYEDEDFDGTALLDNLLGVDDEDDDEEDEDDDA